MYVIAHPHFHAMMMVTIEVVIVARLIYMYIDEHVVCGEYEVRQIWYCSGRIQKVTMHVS